LAFGNIRGKRRVASFFTGHGVQPTKIQFQNKCKFQEAVNYQ